ncbi:MULTISPECIES: glycoside hydrolase family 68 protein [unclassified Sphingomonas]|uniref:glycoside hydrolase family 68 protein n=1 Tax=unclassified Sphingomonas TaxID=196159 RepID=UPI00082B6466|nr:MULTISPECIES: glycoside hydrolase family 68 protein [unclassified Sphingomonas]
MPPVIPTTPWTVDHVRRIATQSGADLPLIGAADVQPMIPGMDLWDMWQLQHSDGRLVVRDGRSLWFFLAAPRMADPGARHDHARIRALSHGPDGWRDLGNALPDGFSPGSREWSGFAVLDDAGGMITLYFTAAGHRAGGPRFAQRLFETRRRLHDDTGEAMIDNWTPPVESIRPDGVHYVAAVQDEAEAGGIKGFRDPAWFRDPADSREYLLFTGSASPDPAAFDGVIGIAARDAGAWRLLPPIVDATGVNRELERPHIVMAGGRYYLFWSTWAHRFAPGVPGRTGLYAMVADRMAGPWRPVNGSGLVAANPVAEPFQAYCWWVTAEHRVISFIDLWGLAGRDPNAPGVARAQFGGTAAPWFALAFDGDRVTIA